MSRFPESSIAYLKRVMLTCSPEFKFQDDDMCELLKITELNPAQILKWADHFRMRYPTEKDRMDFLTTDGFEKDNSTKLNRVFVSCFNVCPEFATAFKFPKANGQGQFNIKYMEAAFNKEAGSGEFYFEFEEKVWSHKLVECFQSQGAGQVMPSTFAHNDGGDSASNALFHVLASQEKTNIKYTRGTCPPALFAKVQAKKAAEAMVQSSSKEFDEKTMAAVRQSLALHEETVEIFKDGMQSHGVKLEGIEHGVCNVIPDYQKEIALLKSQLAHKTALCDRIEGQKGRLTYEINRQKLEIGESVAERESLRNEKKTHLKTIQELQEQLDMCKGIAMLKQMMDETQHTTEILASTLEHENKRQRGV